MKPVFINGALTQQGLRNAIDNIFEEDLGAERIESERHANGLTVAKLKKAREILDANDRDIHRSRRWYRLLSERKDVEHGLYWDPQTDSLKPVTCFKSGAIGQWGGMKWIESIRSPSNADLIASRYINDQYETPTTTK